MFFIRKSSLELLPVAMSGVRMGERALQIGIDDPALAGALAAKVGLSGHAAMAVADETSAGKAREAASRVGALVDLKVTSLESLPFSEASFDVVVVHGMRGLLSSMAQAARTRTLHEAFRILRPGGRIVIIEAGPLGGIRGLLRPREVADAGETLAGLAQAGFRGSRVLVEREGYRFTEGMKA